LATSKTVTNKTNGKNGKDYFFAVFSFLDFGASTIPLAGTSN